MIPAVDEFGSSNAGRFHQAQEEPEDGLESGAQDIVIKTIGETPYAVISDRTFGLIVDQILTN